MARPTGWDILGLDDDPTPGVVETVQGLAKQFGDFAHDVESAYSSLNSFGADTTALDWVGQTAEAFKGQFGPLPGRLQKLYISYSEASDALSAYAPKLQAAQSKADTALRQAQDADVDLQRATTTANNAASDLKTAQQNHAANPNPKAVSDAQTAHDTAQASLKNAQARMDALKAQAHQAHDDLDTAAKDCAKALHHAQHDGIHNKHWWQHVGESLSEWGGKIAEVANEIAPVLDVLAIATVWIPGVDIITGELAEADNMVAMFGTGMQIAGDTMQGHYGDALMSAGMLGITLVGGKAISKLGGKAFESLASKFGRETEGGAENSIGAEARKAEGGRPAKTKDDPVDVVSGWMLTDATDLQLPGVLPIVLRRAYASGYTTGRLFGPGWASTLDQRLSINEAGIHFAGDDNQRLDYPLPIGVEPVLPARGSRWPLVWDRESDEIRISDPWSGQVRHFPVVHYADEFGQIRDVTAISDRNDNRISIQRNENGTPTRVDHPGYHVVVDTIATGAGPRISSLRLLDRDGFGQGTTIKRFQYDGRGRLTGVVNSSGLPFIYEWDENDRIIAWRDRSGYRYGYHYDHLGRVIQGQGKFLAGSFVYEPSSRTTIHTNSLGQVTTYVYDENGHVASETDPLGNIAVTATDAHGKVLTKVDPLGFSTSYERDEVGDIRRVVAPDGATTELDYNQFHQITRIATPDGACWTRTFDERGNLLTATDPTGATTEFEYSRSGALTASTDPLGAVTRYTTDEAGLPVEILDPLDRLIRAERNNAGRIEKLTDPIGAVTSFQWNTEGLLVARTGPDGAIAHWEHDAGGRLVKATSPIGAVTEIEPGPMGTTNARTGPDGVRHTFAYDSELNLLSVTNPSGASWNYSYNAAGRLVGESDFNGRQLGYEYDAAGRLTARVTGAGERIILERDATGQIATRRTPEGDYRYTYSPAGQLISATSSDAVLEYHRDGMGRVLAETSNGRTTRYSYDAAGRLSGRVTASGSVSAWTFDAAGQPVGLDAGGRHLELSYDVSGREIQRMFGSDARLINQYDINGWPTTQQLVTGQSATSAPGTLPSHDHTVVLERSWIWRADGVPEEIRDSTHGTQRVIADAAGRPTAVTAEGWSETYAYDAFGNRAVGAGTDMSPGAAGETPAATGTLIRRSGRTHNDYDSAGRLVRTVRRTLDGRRKTWTFTWDSQDRLVRADTPDRGSWGYTYDPIGRRVSKHLLTDDGQPAERVSFSWDGPRLIEEGLRNPDGTIAIVTWDYDPGTFRPAAQRRRTWVSDADQSAVDEAFHAIITDLVGAPTELVAPDGSIAWHRSADLWGRAFNVVADADVDCPLRFPGQYYDAETGLHYNLHRYYDPETASYLTPDPLGLLPAPNDHAYVPNPLIVGDPLGLAYEESAGGKLSGPAPGPAPEGSTLEEYAEANRGVNQASTPDFVTEYTSPSGARYYGRTTGDTDIEPGSYLDEALGTLHRDTCSEVSAVNEAQKAEGGLSIYGGHFRTLRVRPIGSPRPSGVLSDPCDVSCQGLIRKLAGRYTKMEE